MARHVQSPGHALARTNRAVGEMLTPAATARAAERVARDGIENVIAGLNTGRDKSSYSNFFGFVRPLTRYELENMWRTSWLAKKTVSIPVDDMTREWRTFTFEDDNDNVRLDALQAEEKRLQVKHKVNLAQKWADLYGGCLLVLGVANHGDLSTPLDVTAVRQGELRYLHVIDRWRCSSGGTLVTDLEDPNFGKPDYYLIAESSVRVHHTRVLRFDGTELPYFAWTQNGYWHDSKLQHVYDALRRCDQTTAGVASMVFEANVDVIKGDAISETLSTNNGEQKVLKRFQLASLMKSMNRTLLLDSSEDYDKKGNSFAGLPEVMQQFFVEFTGASGVPYTRLFGQAPGGLNSTGDGDLRNYYDQVVSWREAKVVPQVDLLDQVLVRSGLGSYPDDYGYEWNPLWQVDDETQALIDYQNAQRDQIYLNGGVVTEGLLASTLRLRGTYPSMSDEDVALAEELAEAAHEQALNPPTPPVPGTQPGQPTPGTSGGTVPPGPKPGVPAKKAAKKVATT